MDILSSWFQMGTMPIDMITGKYHLGLVTLSYVVAVFASYVALNLVGRLQLERRMRAKIYWLVGGAFSMGAGIWSMHFIGMLAFIMPMPMTYEISWTIGSLFVAMLASAFALFILQKKDYSFWHLGLGGFLIGLGIATMHYMGMEGMKTHMNIHYVPLLFGLSILIAIGAAEAALVFALQSNKGSSQRQFNLKIISALIMGVAICGMHYMGMAAAVFTPSLNYVAVDAKDIIPPAYLAIFIAGISILIISLALTVSSYYKKMVAAAENEKDFLNAMLDNLKDGIIACDAAGRITVLNKTLQMEIDGLDEQINIAQLSSLITLFTPEDTLVEKDDYPLARILRGEQVYNRAFIYASRMNFRDFFKKSLAI